MCRWGDSQDRIWAIENGSIQSFDYHTIIRVPHLYNCFFQMNSILKIKQQCLSYLMAI